MIASYIEKSIHMQLYIRPTCGVSRWKVNKNSSEIKKKQVPTKIMWYFPPIPRFRRMFRNRKTTKNLI